MSAQFPTIQNVGVPQSTVNDGARDNTLAQAIDYNELLTEINAIEAELGVSAIVNQSLRGNAASLLARLGYFQATKPTVVDGALWWDTVRRMWWIGDTTSGKWLSAQRFKMTCSAAVQAASFNPDYFNPFDDVDTQFDIYVEDLAFWSTETVNQDGTNYWTVKLLIVKHDGSTAQIGSTLDTKLDATSGSIYGWATSGHKAAVDTIVPISSGAAEVIVFLFSATKVATAGTITMSPSATYRYVCP